MEFTVLQSAVFHVIWFIKKLCWHFVISHWELHRETEATHVVSLSITSRLFFPRNFTQRFKWRRIQRGPYKTLKCCIFSKSLCSCHHLNPILFLLPQRESPREELLVVSIAALSLTALRERSRRLQPLPGAELLPPRPAVGTRSWGSHHPSPAPTPPVPAQRPRQRAEGQRTNPRGGGKSQRPCPTHLLLSPSRVAFPPLRREQAGGGGGEAQHAGQPRHPQLCCGEAAPEAGREGKREGGRRPRQHRAPPGRGPAGRLRGLGLNWALSGLT